jgi:uncharacterized protein
MVKVGKIKALWRYPVKGMPGESLQQCHLSDQGLYGDRLWALRDSQREEIQSCKFRPELLMCSAQLINVANTGEPRHVNIKFPNGKVFRSDNQHLNAALSQLVRHASTLEYRRTIDDLDFYRRHKKDDTTWLTELKQTFEREPGESLPDLDHLPQSAQDFVSIPGTFFLVSPLHFVTTATIEYLKSQTPHADWSIERFRPNVLIETETGLEGLVEQSWVQHRLNIKNVSIDCTDPTPRCGAITKPQPHIGFDKQVLRTVVAKANQNVGIYGQTQDVGVISVGDEVFLETKINNL